MLGLLLFLILVVLLYATGLLPGIMKAISGFLALTILIFAGGFYGWTAVIGAFILAAGFAFLGVWIAGLISARKSKARFNSHDIHRQLERVNAEERLNKASEHPPESDADTTPSPRSKSPSAEDFDQPVEVTFSYQAENEPPPSKQHASIHRVSSKDGRVFFKASCLKSGAARMYMLDRVDGYISNPSTGRLLNPSDYKRAEAFKAALLKLT